MIERIRIIGKKNIIKIYCLFIENSIEKRFVLYNIAMVNCYPRDIERLVVLVLYEKKSFNPDDCGDVASGFWALHHWLRITVKKNDMWLISGGFNERCSPIEYWRIPFYSISKKLNNDAFFLKEIQFFC